MSWRASVGAGIMWLPFGPLRFDYAVPVAGRTSTGQNFRFSMANQF
jgi:outer membrane protein assembly factor BamA